MALIALTLLLLALAVWIALREDPKDIVGRFPLGADDNVPSVSLILAAGAAAAGVFIGLAALHAAAAIRVLARDRRLPRRVVSRGAPVARARADAVGPVDGPARRRAGASGRQAPGPPFAPALRLTVLVPAHDESLTIGATLESLWGQARPPDQVVVVADNCTDDTADVARRGGATVFTTVGNDEKKAGALNQALAEMFDHIDGTRRRDDHGRRLGHRARAFSRPRWDVSRPTLT